MTQSLFSVVKLGKGKVTHIGAGEKKRARIRCGSEGHGNTFITNTGLAFKRENITCKKCLARFDEIQQEALSDQEKLSTPTEIAQPLTAGMSMTFSKEEWNAMQ